MSEGSFKPTIRTRCALFNHHQIKWPVLKPPLPGSTGKRSINATLCASIYSIPLKGKSCLFLSRCYLMSCCEANETIHFSHLPSRGDGLPSSDSTPHLLHFILAGTRRGGGGDGQQKQRRRIGIEPGGFSKVAASREREIVERERPPACFLRSFIARASGDCLPLRYLISRSLGLERMASSGAYAPFSCGNS